MPAPTSDSLAAEGPLHGVRVVEVGGVGPAPFCTMVLADMGADVVRVERPGSGDVSLFTRGKRSITLDLKREDDLGHLVDLIAVADVVVEGFRPGAAERLGIGPEAARAASPALVYVRCTGWGQSGPMSAMAGHDINYIALTGILGQIGPANGRPVPPLNLIGDFAGGGLLAAFGATCALLERNRSGLGQVVDTAMVDGSSLLATMFHEMLAMGAHDETARGTNTLDGGAPYYDTYATADGRWFAVGAVEQEFYDELLLRLGLDQADVPDRSDRNRWPELRACLAEAFAGRTFAEWEVAFEGSDACATPVLTPSEATSHPQMAARSSFIDVRGILQPAPAPRFSRTPATVRPISKPRDDATDILVEWTTGR